MQMQMLYWCDVRNIRNKIDNYFVLLVFLPDSRGKEVILKKHSLIHQVMRWERMVGRYSVLE